MKTSSKYSETGPLYEVSEMTAHQFVAIQRGLVKAATDAMVYHYECGGRTGKSRRDSAVRVALAFTLNAADKSDRAREIVKGFKSQIRRQIRRGGHFRFGRWVVNVSPERV